MTVAAVFGRREGGELYADLFVRQSNEEHMLRSIIDTYVYDSCDYFVCLDVHHDSYVIFSGSKLEKRRLSSFGSGYERAMVEYANSYVVPEEREPLIRKMRLEQVVKQLNDREVYSLTAGVEDPERNLYAVQWHPEDLVESHPRFRPLFRHLVERAEQYAGR